MTAETGDLLRVVARFTGVEQNVVENVYHFGLLTSATVSDQDCLLQMQAVMEAVYTEIVSLYAPEFEFVDMLVHNVTTNTPIGEIPWDTLSVGTGALEAMASGVAACVTFPTAVNRKRGRKFIGPLSLSDINEGVINTASLVKLSNYAAALLTTFILGTPANTWYYVVGQVGVGFSLPTGAIVRAIPAYQRRRKAGVGI